MDLYLPPSQICSIEKYLQLQPSAPDIAFIVFDPFNDSERFPHIVYDIQWLLIYCIVVPQTLCIRSFRPYMKHY